MPPNLKFHIETIGEGIPIVPIHGWNGNLEDMQWLFEPIFADRPGWKRIYFDLPGHGRTPGPEWISTAPEMMEAVWQMLDEQSQGQPFALSGFSYGAYIALGLARSHPDRLLGLAGINPVVVSDFEKRITAQFEVSVDDGSFERLLPKGDVEALSAIISNQSEQVANNLLSMKDGPIGDQAFLNAIRRDPLRFHIPDAEAALEKIFTRPGLFIAGRHDQISGYEQLMARELEFPNAEFVLLENAGHLAYVEHSNTVRGLITNLLDNIQNQL
jgi:pimeloyl-ACP methyl ester carboxylesterase